MIGHGAASPQLRYRYSIDAHQDLAVAESAKRDFHRVASSSVVERLVEFYIWDVPTGQPGIAVRCSRLGALADAPFRHRHPPLVAHSDRDWGRWSFSSFFLLSFFVFPFVLLFNFDLSERASERKD